MDSDMDKNEDRGVNIEIGTERTGDPTRVILLTLLIVIVAVVAAGVILSLSYLFFLLAASILFAYLLAPLVSLLRQPFRGTRLNGLMPRWLAILIVYVVVFVLVGVGIANIAPRVSEQGREFGANLPTYAASVRKTLNDINRRFDRLRIPEELQTTINDQAAAVGESITQAFSGFLFSAAKFVPFIVIVPVFAFFFLKDAGFIRLLIVRVFPPGPLQERVSAILEDVNKTLVSYTRAQIISCILIGTVCTIGFYLIGLRYALLLGILAGLFEVVPLLGPLAIGVIATATGAFGDEPERGLYTAAFLIVLRIVHDYVTYPRIVRGGIQLHPLLIILSVIAGEQVAGIPGVFIAIPIVAVFTVIYRHVLEHHGETGLLPKSDEVKAELAESGN